jgi:trimethylamine--corrinoid protein Co-methyltransferase
VPILRLVEYPRDELDTIHSATLKVLRNVGVKFPDKYALDALKSAGADIDYETEVARFPENTVRDALNRAPHVVTLCGRDPSHNIRLGENGGTHFMPSGIGVYIYDLDTGQRRTASRVDAANVSKIVDALPNIHVLQVMVSPGDVPDKIADHFKFEAAFNNTTKHVSNCIGPVTSDDGARDIVEMASTIVGGREELRKRPIISVHQCPISPLQYDVHGLRAIMEYARSCVPVCIYSMAMGGGTAPATIAGELVVINAEFLAGLVLLQKLNPGCPVIYGTVASVMDLKTGVLPLGAPERPILQIGVVSLARYYGVPHGMISAGHTDAQIPGSQAGFEKAITALPVVLAGTELILGAGAVDSANTYSYEQLVIDDEIWGAMLRIQRGFEVDEDTIAEDLIEKIGIGKHFIGEKHTLSHVQKEQWYPRLYSRIKRSEDIFNEDVLGKRDLAMVARQKAKDILKTHQAQPLEKDTQQKIRALVRNAERRVQS